MQWTWTSSHKAGNYRYVQIPEHPNADAKGRMLEHRLVAENHLGRLLLPSEEVHHLNTDGTDNTWENLEVLDGDEHDGLHAAERRRDAIRFCAYCGEPIYRTERQFKGALAFCNRSHSASYYGTGQRRRGDPVISEHGTYGRYRKGCHCVDCRAANTARNKK